MSVSTLVGKPLPNFTAESQLGEITIDEYCSLSWTLIVTMPANFDPVHSSVRTWPSPRAPMFSAEYHLSSLPKELGKLASMKEEFDERNCKLCAIVIGSGEVAVVARQFT